MPYFRRRRSYSRRRFNRRKASPKKYYSRRYPIRKAIVSVAKKIRTLQKDVETKVLTTVISDGSGPGLQDQTSYSGTPVITNLSASRPAYWLLNGMSKGTGQAHRIGDDIRVTSVHLSGQVYVTAGGATLGINAPVRMMIVSAKKPRGAALLPSFDNSTQMSSNPSLSGLFNCSGTNQPTTYTQVDTENSVWEDYKVHYDHVYHLKTQVGTEYLGRVTGTVDASVNPFFEFNIKKKINMRCDMSRGNQGTWTDFEKNSLWLLMIADTSSSITVALDSNCYFKDA